MKCPYCHVEMKPGNVFGDHYRLKWMPEDQKLIQGIWVHNAIELGENRLVFHLHRLKAYVCANCKKLIADIEAP